MGNSNTIERDVIMNGGEKQKENEENENAEEKWKVVDTPQETGLLPTLGVTFWLGWMGALVKISLVVMIFGSLTLKMIWIGLCTLSLILPSNFPEPFGRLVLGRFLMKQGERYFGLKTTIETPDLIQNIAKSKAIIFAKEPHDILPYSVFCFSDSLARILPYGSKMTALTTGAIFNIPIIKQVYSWVGCAPVDKKTFRRKLDENESFCFVPGGVQEVLMLADLKDHPEAAGAKGQLSQETVTSTPDDDVDTTPIPLYLKSRKGFIKLALNSGSPICPVFAFGLDKSYDYIIPPGLSSISRRIGVCPVLFTGRWGIPFGIPKPTKIHVVVGKPINIPKIDSEDNEKVSSLIDKYHSLYLQELEALYERHKDEAGYGQRKIVIF